jgi:hypothetical protein
MDGQVIHNAKFLADIEWLESLGLEPFTGGRLRYTRRGIPDGGMMGRESCG